MDAGAAVQVPGDAARTKGQFADEASCTVVASSARVNEAELALLEFEHGDVGFGSDIEIPQPGTADLRGGVCRRHPNQLLKRYTEQEHLREHIEHVLHPGVDAPVMHVGGDRVRPESLLRQRNRDVPEEAAGAVPQIEE